MNGSRVARRGLSITSHDSNIMSTKFQCPTCGKDRPLSERVPGERLRASIRERMRADNPGWNGAATCRSDVRACRMLLVREALEEQHGRVGELDALVLARMERNLLLSNRSDSAPSSVGDRVADRVASFGGSWTFLGIFAIVMLTWMAVNIVLAVRAFDPYPFILLNLVLSCLAAVQAPVIMMSQNRQAAKDRAEAEHDYQVNLKAELEVQMLHEKLDHLIFEEWHRLLEIQAIQMEMLEDLAASRRSVG